MIPRQVLTPRHGKKQQEENLAIALDAGFVIPFDVELGPGKHGPAIDRFKIGLNEKSDPGSHVYWDLEGGIPLPDGCVSHIRSGQTLEHIWNIILLFNEMWRVLVPGGTMHHDVPHYLSIFADGDPTHVRKFSEASFNYYCVRPDGKPFVENFSDYGITCAFELTEIDVRPRLDITAWFLKPRT